jgi:uncharacterized protein (TIGR02466 family)
MVNYQKQPAKITPPRNAAIIDGFLKHYQDDDVKKTHLFGGRYENIYLNQQHIPELKTLGDEAIAFAEDILNTKNLRIGYWFNYMPPNASTTLHTHDDDDELLSAVYYLLVPEDSGNLIIYDDTDTSNSEMAQKKRIEISPKAGEFIFFKPDVRHEVSKNNSKEYRLSVGINFGLDR